MAENQKSSWWNRLLLRFSFSISTFLNTANIPTKMGEQIAITVRDPSPSLSTAAYILLLQRTAFICVCAVMRIQWAHEDEKNQSVFDNNGAFKTIGIVALYAVAVVAGVLWCANTCLYWPMRDVFYTILKFVGSFSAFLAPFSLLMVLVLPPILNWIGYMGMCVMFGIMVACYYLDDQQQGKRFSIFHDVVLLLVPMLILLVLWVPENLNHIVYPLTYLTLGTENAYHLVTYLMFISRKPHNFEADQLIQQDQHNSYLQVSYLQVLGRN